MSTLARLRWHRDLSSWSVVCRVCPSLTALPVAQDATGYGSLTVVAESVRYHLAEHAAGRALPPFRFYYPTGA